MPELGPLGSVRGALRNERPYRDHEHGLLEEITLRIRVATKSNTFVGVLPANRLLDLPTTEVGKMLFRKFAAIRSVGAVKKIDALNRINVGERPL